MKSIYSHLIIFTFLFLLPTLAEEKPEVARLIQGNKKMSNQVIELMGSLKKGIDKITYDVHAGYGDGGSTGINFKINQKSTLVFFIPWWQKDWRDARLGINKVDDSVPDWSKTLEEDPKLRAAVIDALEHLVDSKKALNIKDKKTKQEIISILSYLKLKPIKVANKAQ